MAQKLRGSYYYSKHISNGLSIYLQVHLWQVQWKIYLSNSPSVDLIKSATKIGCRLLIVINSLFSKPTFHSDAWKAKSRIESTQSFFGGKVFIENLLPVCWGILWCSWQDKCIVRIGTLLSLIAFRHVTVWRLNKGGWHTIIKGKYCWASKCHIKPESKTMKWCWKKRR